MPQDQSISLQQLSPRQQRSQFQNQQSIRQPKHIKNSIGYAEPSLVGSSPAAVLQPHPVQAHPYADPLFLGQAAVAFHGQVAAVIYTRAASAPHNFVLAEGSLILSKTAISNQYNDQSGSQNNGVHRVLCTVKVLLLTNQQAWHYCYCWCGLTAGAKSIAF